MADPNAPTYPAGVLSYAPDRQVYEVGLESYEALLRANGKNAAAAERRLRLLKRALVTITGTGDTALELAIQEEIDGRPATV